MKEQDKKKTVSKSVDKGKKQRGNVSDSKKTVKKKTTDTKNESIKKKDTTVKNGAKRNKTSVETANTSNKPKRIAKKEKEILISELDKELKVKIDKLESNNNEFLKNNIEKRVELSFSLFEVILLIIITILSCILIFDFSEQTLPDTTKANDNEVTNKYTEKDIEFFLEQYNYILNNYYGDIDKEQLLEDAIEGMFSSLDDYSQVIGTESNSFSVTLTGEYEGVGISIYNDEYGNIVIQNIYEDTPAFKAGLMTNDIIKKFNDIDLTNIDSSELVNMIGSADEMKLTVSRNGNEFIVVLKKEKIVLKSVNYEMLDNKIGYIDVDLFAANTYEQFETALKDLEKQGIKSLIIDLRDNTGGHLSTVEKMLYLFLNKSNIIYQMEDKSGVEKVYSQGNVNKKYDIVILQNGLSASASEIMAAALKENLDAYIIGNRSFGKGTVQTLIDAADDLQYKFTTKRWLTPKGNWVEGVGVQSDLEVNLSGDYYINPSFENDNQLKEAINYLNK